MIQKHFKLILAILFIGVTSIGFAEGTNHDHDNHNGHKHESSSSHSANAHAEHSEDKKFNASEMIMHHIKDANEFHVYGDIHFPLPVILYDKNNGFKFMMSSSFDHGHKAIDGFVLDHGIVKKIKGDFPMGVQAVEVHHGQVSSNGHHFETETKNTMFINSDSSFYDFSITKNVFALLLSVIIMLIVFISMARFYKKGNMVPKGLYSALEPFVLYVRDDIAVENIGEKKADKFLPLLLTIFFFIWLNNIMGLIPFFPFSANVTGNIAFTFVLSAIVLIVVNINGNKDYWMHMLWMPGIPTPMKLVMAPIELIGIITKPFALMMRLFANITAGHILILSLVSLIFIFNTTKMSAMSIPFMLFINMLEVLVAFLQAYIFTLLTALFIGMAVAEHEHH